MSTMDLSFVINDMNETYVACEGKNLFVYMNKAKQDFVVRANGVRRGHSWPGNMQSRHLLSYFEGCGLDLNTPARHEIIVNNLNHTIIIA